MIDRAEASDLVRQTVRDIPDFPSPGVVYKDITPLLADARAFSAVSTYMSQKAAEWNADLVVGMEARGFALAAPAAYAAGLGFVPLRKAGKLPGLTMSENYDLEYGSAELEIHADAIQVGQRVLVIDDVLATGGTAAATCSLLERVGAEVVGLSFLLELSFLGGREPLLGRRIDALVTV